MFFRYPLPFTSQAPARRSLLLLTARIKRTSCLRARTSSNKCISSVPRTKVAQKGPSRNVCQTNERADKLMCCFARKILLLNTWAGWKQRSFQRKGEDALSRLREMRGSPFPTVEAYSGGDIILGVGGEKCYYFQISNHLGLPAPLSRESTLD